MKNIYIVSNNAMSKLKINYPKEISLYEIREKTMLSKIGDVKALNLLKLEELKDIEVIYSSSYVSALNTCKYIAEERNLNIIVDKRLNERVVGELGSNEYLYLKGMQEHDFNYKLKNGESILEVKKRMEEFFNDLIKSEENDILVVTHHVALMSLLLKWCSKDYNSEERLVLLYNDDTILDGTYQEMDMIKISYDGCFKDIQVIL